VVAVVAVVVVVVVVVVAVVVVVVVVVCNLFMGSTGFRSKFELIFRSWECQKGKK